MWGRLTAQLPLPPQTPLIPRRPTVGPPSFSLFFLSCGIWVEATAASASAFAEEERVRHWWQINREFGVG